MASSLGFTAIHYLHSHGRLSPPAPASYFPVSHISMVIPSLSIKNNYQLMKLKRPVRASLEGPDELIEDSKFVPLNAEDPRYGPPALLLLGFELEEAAEIQQLLKELDGEFMEVIYCTEDMIPRSLWEAVNTRQPNLGSLKIAKSVPRICFLSGLSGEEMMMFIDAFPEAGLKPAVFAALVPNSANKPVQELIEEIMGDHEMLTRKKSGLT
ncbi:uncharacterized protein LOC110814535 [Carica papaya]|uniref:uncharacterized protein LOC110814535 n=1 Tax=Carica papaya TaxID=3649 RepID=UPI000B8C838D|nr:uncharacterized protein LOC110814535 [Carica papaya]XP_021897707.1 uncharacterized protein LOC110814535 [Carica papaya]